MGAACLTLSTRVNRSHRRAGYRGDRVRLAVLLDHAATTRPVAISTMFLATYSSSVVGSSGLPF